MSCVGCKYYSELKKPRAQRHRSGFVYTIHGYCFYDARMDDYNKGLPVFVPETPCKRFERAAEVEG